ncbi:MAG: endolytic transglycosylase MltG [Candidatus Acidiferrum sp.]
MKALVIIVLILLLAAAAATGFLWYSIEKPFGTIPTAGIFVDIPHGISQRAAAHILRKNGIIRSSIAFEIYARRHPKRSLQAGEYFFDHPLTGKEVFWKLANGDVYQQPFTVKEGDTIFDIAHNLQAAKYMHAAEFVKAASDATQVQDFAPGAKTLEGFLFPATYNLPRHAEPAELTAMMVRKFREAVQQIDPERLDPPTPGMPLLSVVTLASLVETETPKPDERPLVAGVYTNRLSKGMLLQCDPTVIYALKQVDQYNPPLTLKDLRHDSPFNTYLHRGLPPSPIGNPGESAIRAALTPARTDLLYFVSNTHGGHFFASTLAEHNRNVAKYHRLLKGEPADPPVTEAHQAHAGGSARKGKR